METTNWLIVESFENWSVDQRNGFTHFGLTSRSYRLKDRFKKGDFLFAYVTRRSSFSDIRRVVRDGLRELRMGGDYALALPYCVDTEPVLTLAMDRWIPIGEVKDRLKLTSGSSHWGSIFRASPKSLHSDDAALLTKIMNARTSG